MQQTTTQSGIDVPGGLIAEQCLAETSSLRSQNTPYLAMPVERKTFMVDSFAFPSQKIMLRLLGIFSGKTGRTPEKYLSGEVSLNDEFANKQVSDFVDTVLQEAVVKESYGENNELVRKVEQTAIISNNPLVDGTASIPADLFKDDLEQREGKLALYIKKTFGSEGLRHLLGLIIGLDEHGRNGSYYFTINEHLQRLGYKRSKNGSFDPAIKWKALRIIEVLSSLHLTISSKRGKKAKVSCIKLFTLERYDVESLIESGEPIHMNFVLRANDDWYGQAFQALAERSQQYTQLLKKIATENHREHPLAITLTPQLAIRWRINQFRPIKLRVSTLMELCGLKHSSDNRNRMRELRDMEAEFNYMMEAGYLGDWCGIEPVPSDEKQPFSCVLTLHAPDWLCRSMERRVQTLPKAVSTISVEGLKWIQKQADLNQSNLAAHLGVSRQHINNVLNGRSKISYKLSQTITEVFGDILEESVN